MKWSWSKTGLLCSYLLQQRWVYHYYLLVMRAQSQSALFCKCVRWDFVLSICFDRHIAWQWGLLEIEITWWLDGCFDFIWCRHLALLAFLCRRDWVTWHFWWTPWMIYDLLFNLCVGFVAFTFIQNFRPRSRKEWVLPREETSIFEDENWFSCWWLKYSSDGVFRMIFLAIRHTERLLSAKAEFMLEMAVECMNSMNGLSVERVIAMLIKL